MKLCLTLKDFAEAFGIEEAALPKACLEKIANSDFSCGVVGPEEKGRLTAEIVKKLDAGGYAPVGRHRRAVWEKGWEEDLKLLKEGAADPESLLPKYYRSNHHLRWQGKWIAPSDPLFEIHFFTVLRLWLFGRFFSGADAIVEIGCGTGLNLLLLAKMFPRKKLWGLDWTASSQKIIAELARRNSLNLDTRPFDFFRPDFDFQLGKKSAVLTAAALEQVGSDFGPFLEYLLAQKPSVVLNIEPLHELYDAGDPFDALALRYHEARGYLRGYLTALQRLEEQKRIEILSLRRLRFGGLHNESYSWVAWRPL